MPKKITLSASLEDYLEAIYHIIKEKHVARSKEIAAILKVSRASVTEALRALAKRELINYAPYEAITMTTKGNKAAESVIFRHDALKQFFIEVLAVDPPVAEEGACRVEHAAPPEVIAHMISFIEFLKIGPRGGNELLQGFADYCKQGKTQKRYDENVSHCLNSMEER
jgi:DtxR family Mn-dependent transcriptional regulator